MIKSFVKKYSFFLMVFLMTIAITLINKEAGFKSFGIAFSSFKQMVSVVPPIMLMLGLMDVWVPRETMMKYMGDNSGITGIILAILIGSVAAGPMYAAFPFTTVLLRKGVKFSNIIIFMNAWCVTKISTLVFEFTALGFEFTFARFLINLPGVIIMGYLVEALIPENELDRLYANKT